MAQIRIVANNVRVRAFFADASEDLPSLPADFWSGGNPFAGSPTAMDWTPIGPTQTLALLEPAEPGVLEWDWTVPASAAPHSCLLAVATSDEDAIAGSGIFAIGTLLTTKKHATLKNLHVENAVPGGIQPESIQIELHNPGNEQALFDLLIDWGSLPNRARLYLAFERGGKQRAFDLRGQTGRESGIERLKGRRKPLPGEVPGRCGEVRRIDLANAVELRPASGPSTLLRTLQIPAGGRILAVLRLSLPELDREVQLDVIQRQGRRIVGGSTYVFKPKPSA